MSVGSEFSLEKAKKLQLILSKKVIRKDCLPESIGHIAGIDVAYGDGHCFGAVAVFEYDLMKLIETETSCRMTRVPYLRTFLSFRELPPAISAIEKLRIEPDVYLVDGHGFAHPRRLGFASHLGVVLDTPTIGVAKSILCGETRTGRDQQWNPIVYEEETIGGEVFTKPGAKPVYVSIGHKVSLKTAIETVLHCAGKYRIPEPLREAHMAAERRRKSQSQQPS